MSVFLLLMLAWTSRVPQKIKKNWQNIHKNHIQHIVTIWFCLSIQYFPIWVFFFKSWLTVRGKVHQFWTSKTLANDFIWVNKGQNCFYIMWMMPNHWPDPYLWPKTTKSSSCFQWRLNKHNWELKQNPNRNQSLNTLLSTNMTLFIDGAKDSERTKI